MRTFLALTALALASAAHAGSKEACDYSARYMGVTCLVMVDGKIVHEAYASPSDESELHRLASGTKSFNGVAAAAAVQDGLLTLDEKVSDTVTEWRADGRKDITIRQLLNLTSGIDTPAPGRGQRPTPAEAVKKGLAFPPGTKFVYGPVPFQVFAELMARKLKGESYLAYVERRILKPLGVSLGFKPLGVFVQTPGADWAGGGTMTARDWARFGEFVRLGGKWNGQQLVDPAALAGNFKGSSVHGGYGVTWWLKPPKGATVPLEGTTENATDFYKGGADALPISQLWMAAGAGNQRMIVIPERNMVAVRQSNRLLLGERSGFSDVEFVRLLLTP
jgi:CubicO group peptidase (beta-lactamase class C family)